jgi:hypothetical protein
MTARLIKAAVVGLLAVFLPATPASAHGQDAPIATNHRVVIDRIEPAAPGVTVRSVEAGARLELTNNSAATVEILGLQGEPFLRVRPDGVDENRNSPTLYASRSLHGDAPPAGLGAGADWRATSDRPVVRWHEERARSQGWSVPLMLNGADPAVIRGTVEAVPAPAVTAWWIGALLLAVVGATTARARVPLAIALGTVAIALTVAFAAAVTTPGAAGEFAGQLVARGWSLLTGLGVLAAGLVSARRRADLALAATAGCVAVAAGLAHSGVLANAVIAGPSWIRPAVAVVIGLGAGVTLSAARAWYRTLTSSGTGVATTTGPS